MKIEQNFHRHKPIEGINAVMKVRNGVRNEDSVSSTQICCT